MASSAVVREIRRRLERQRAGRAPGGDAKLGLVVEGGGMRGAISAGALVALERLGLTSAFDAVLGTSHMPRSSRYVTVDSLLSLVMQLASAHCLGMLILDELQNVSVRKSGVNVRARRGYFAS